MKLLTHLFLQQRIALLSSELKSDLPMHVFHISPRVNDSKVYLRIITVTHALYDVDTQAAYTQCLRKWTVVSYMQYYFLHVSGCFQSKQQALTVTACHRLPLLHIQYTRAIMVLMN